MKSSVLLLLIFITANLCAAQAVKRTITNDDLEKYKQPRLKAEADYRENYKKLGMPSPEELEKIEAERRARNEDFSRKYTAEKQQTAGYYQAQANQLKVELVNTQAQINYLQAQIGNVPNQNSVFVSPDQVYGVGVLPSGYSRRTVAPVRPLNQGSSVQAAINAAASAPNPFYGTPLYPAGIKLVIGAANPVGRGGGRGGYGRPSYYGGYPVPYVANSGSNQRDALISQLRYMEQVKAGLLAQYNLIQEEARRAGVRID